MKIRRVGAELFRANGRTDMTKLIVAFRHFANVPNKYSWAGQRAGMLDSRVFGVEKASVCVSTQSCVGIGIPMRQSPI